MVAFDRDTFLHNVYFLAKEKNMKLGDLETNAGVSPGYLSRLNKEGVTTVPTIELACALAQQLGVSVDALVDHRLDELSPTDRYLLEFIYKVTEKTNRLELLWDFDDIYALNDPECDQNGEPYHPLFYSHHDGNRWVTEYASLFARGARPDGSGFYVLIGEDTRLYLMHVNSTEDREASLLYDSGYELYLVKRGTINPLCWFRQPVFVDALTRLGSAAFESTRHPKLNDTVRSSIDAFMAGKFTVDKDAVDDDGEVPF